MQNSNYNVNLSKRLVIDTEHKTLLRLQFIIHWQRLPYQNYLYTFFYMYCFYQNSIKLVSTNGVYVFHFALPSSQNSFT
jgi:hypothetical protein